MKIINLLGNEYQGTIGKSVTASKWKGRNYLKKWFKPVNPNTAGQQTVRALMTAAVALWHTFNLIQKGAYYWAQRYHKRNISPFNQLTGTYIKLGGTGGTYVAPPTAVIDVDEPDASPAIGAKVIIRKTGQATDYMLEYTDSNGHCASGVVVEEQNYDMFITLEGFVPYEALDKTAAEIQATHTLTPV